MTRLILAGFLTTALTLPPATTAQNALQGAFSPYLLQHADNPVDWYLWGPEALEKARTQDKPIFVSVGYSSCHWCHVMREESFENTAIAGFLNANFISIKVDRETRPDLDERFQRATGLLSGSGGWPNSVFLTPGGDPYFAGGYFPPDAFMDVLSQVAAAWRDDPQLVDAEAKKVARATMRHLSRASAVREVPPATVHRAALALLEELDEFHGGLGHVPKFPREPLFLFLLDQAERSGDRRLLDAVTQLLDHMIAGGIHDHVGGGFHRYAVDPEWREPHFEKMLYTQALTGRLLLRAYAATGAARYRRAAERTLDYVLRDLRAPSGGFHAAQDADSLDRNGLSTEGAYYTWRPPDLSALRPLDAALVRDLFGIDGTGPFDGAHALHLDVPPDYEITADLDRVLNHLRVVREARPSPLIDRKIVLSWNAAMIETLAEASFLLDRPEYFSAAVEATEFLLETLKLKDGWRRIHFRGAAEVDAQLPDLAGLGMALIALHDYASEPKQASVWLRHAQDLARDIRVGFGAPEAGYRLTRMQESGHEIVTLKDGDLPSGNALALTLFARLSRRAPLPWIERDAHQLAGALAERAIERPRTRASALKALEELRAGGSQSLRFAAKGAVRVTLQPDRPSGSLTLEIAIADGWHINARQPLQDYLIATELSLQGNNDLDVRFPDPVIKSLSLNAAPLALYEGQLSLPTTIPDASPGEPGHRVALTLQACSDSTCLQPETLVFVLW